MSFWPLLSFFILFILFIRSKLLLSIGPPKLYTNFANRRINFILHSDHTKIKGCYNISNWQVRHPGLIGGFRYNTALPVRIFFSNMTMIISIWVFTGGSMLQIDDSGSGSFVGGTCIGVY